MNSPSQTSNRTHKALAWVVAASVALYVVAFLLLFARDLGVDCGWFG